MRRHLPIFSATAARLLFFGGRFLSLLLVARFLGENASGFLLAIAIVEVLRVVFDYGLENSMLARRHQKEDDSGAEFARGNGSVRWMAALVGQVVASALITALCIRNDVAPLLPLVASLQFGCLMAFGYLQAHLQTGRPGGMAFLVLPLAVAIVVQALLLWLAQQRVIPLAWCVIIFELMAVAACVVALRQNGCSPITAKLRARGSGVDWAASRSVLVQIAPLGNVAMIGIAYNRLDAFAVSLFASGTLLVQYLIYQRVASAPLMFFSTVASASISSMSLKSVDAVSTRVTVTRYRQAAYGIALLSGCALFASSPVIARFFFLSATDQPMLVAQSLILTLQIANGFHASILIAHGKVTQLWRIAQRNAVAALVVLPCCIWIWQGLGIAIALCVVEAFCAAQHAWAVRRSGPRLEELHA